MLNRSGSNEDSHLSRSCASGSEGSAKKIAREEAGTERSAGFAGVLSPTGRSVRDQALQESAKHQKAHIEHEAAGPLKASKLLLTKWENQRGVSRREEREQQAVLARLSEREAELAALGVAAVPSAADAEALANEEEEGPKLVHRARRLGYRRKRSRVRTVAVESSEVVRTPVDRPQREPGALETPVLHEQRCHETGCENEKCLEQTGKTAGPLERELQTRFDSVQRRLAW